MLVGLCTEWAKKVGPQNHGHGYRILADFQNIVFSMEDSLVWWPGAQSARNSHVLAKYSLISKVFFH